MYNSLEMVVYWMEVNLPNIHETGSANEYAPTRHRHRGGGPSCEAPCLGGASRVGRLKLCRAWRADAARASLGLDLDHDSEDSLLLTSSINA